MVKLISNGITIEVPPSDVEFYIRAGYVKVETAPVEKSGKPEKGESAVDESK